MPIQPSLAAWQLFRFLTLCANIYLFLASQLKPDNSHSQNRTHTLNGLKRAHRRTVLMKSNQTKEIKSERAREREKFIFKAYAKYNCKLYFFFRLRLKYASLLLRLVSHLFAWLDRCSRSRSPCRRRIDLAFKQNYSTAAKRNGGLSQRQPKVK